MCNPLFVEKKNGKIRTCIDYRPINQAIADFDWPIPRLQDIRHRLVGARWFSRFDLRDAFHHMRIREEDRGATSFWTPRGPHRFLRMPFGLKTAPSYFQRCIENDLRHVLDIVIPYIDDTLVFAQTLPGLLQREKRVLRALRQTGHEVAWDKSERQIQELTFCGLRLSQDGVSATTDITKIQDYAIPYRLVDRQSFLGFANYFRDYIPDFSRFSEPLNPNKKNIPRSTNYDESFRQFLQACMHHVTLNHYRGGKLRLFTDASLYAMGAVLVENGNVIALCSRKFTPAQTRYSATDREHLALLLAVEKFKVFCHGNSGVTLKTDHKALLNRSDELLTPRQTRWKFRILACTSRIEYEPGMGNPADFWSRRGSLLPVRGPV